MASKKSETQKSEGPFFVLNVSHLQGGESITDQLSVSGYAFKTRVGLEKYIENNKTGTAKFFVFDAISKVTFEHTVHYGAVNV